MSPLFEMLKKIQARPGLYIGRASVSDLFMFIIGYRTAREELGIEPTETELDFYGEFQPWLQKRLKMTTSNSWARMIEFGCGNEKAAFERFFELLDEFLQRDDHAIAPPDDSVDLLEVS
ncbi:hypothetical protein [Chlorogloeopsis sp. ULAP02]|uniref:hypothetical protein n=1 Tax=Chlorogloeopsis sp. ULAP02 TaxID=3107926 RepID=UPI003134D8CB